MTTTLPPSRTDQLVTTREFATSQIVEVGIFMRRRWSRGEASATVVPAGGARLRVDLPDKYPGRPVHAGAPFSSVHGEAGYRQSAGPITVRLGARFARIVGWRNSASVRLTRASVFLELAAN